MPLKMRGVLLGVALFCLIAVVSPLHMTRSTFLLTTSLQIFPSFDDPMNQKDVRVAEFRTSSRKESSSSSPVPPKPFAPVKFLVPAMRISYEIDRLTTELDDPMFKLPPPSAYPLLLDSRTRTYTLRKAFDTYTGSLQFGEDYTLNVEGGQRKEMIRNDALPSVKQTITADLDLRDLYRNDILTTVQDLRAELDFEQRSDLVDVGELKGLVGKLADNMRLWLEGISNEDRQTALEIVKNST